MKTVARYLFSLIIFFISTELLLRVLALGLSLGQDLANHRAHSGELPELRVLCLGESTSSSAFSGNEDASWPRVLEKELNARAGELGFRTTVYNESVPGTNSALINLRLPQQLEKYKPHVVVTMMGINDSYQFLGLRLKPNPLRDILSPLKIFRVIDYFFPGLFSQFNVKTDLYEPIPEGVEPGLHEMLYGKKITPELLDALEAAYAPKNSGAAESSLFYEYVGQQLHFISIRPPGGQTSDEVLDICSRYLERHFSLEGLNDYYLYRMSLCAKRNPASKEKFIERAMALLDRGASLNNQTLSIMINSEKFFKPGDYARFLARHGLEKTADGRFLWSSQSSYHGVYNQLRERNILYFSMMYPTGRKEALARLLSEEKLDYRPFVQFMYETNPETPAPPPGTFLVSNENFSKDCPETLGDCYLDLWTQSEGGHFGHTTAKGHRMIAENLLRAFLENKEVLRAQTGLW